MLIIRRVLIIIAIFTVGCAHSKFAKLKDLDETDKTIGAAPGASRLLGEIKSIFRENGYQIIASTGGSQTNRVTDGKEVTTSKNYYRYSLVLRSDKVDSCLPTFDPLYEYELTIIDTKDGTEVINAHGRDCQGDIVSGLNSTKEGSKSHRGDFAQT